MILALVALVLGQMLVLVTSLLMMASMEVQIAENHLASTQAFFLAESGLELTLRRLQQGESLDAPITLAGGTITLYPTIHSPDAVSVRSIGRIRNATRILSIGLWRDVSGDGQWHFAPTFREEEAP